MRRVTVASGVALAGTLTATVLVACSFPELSFETVTPDAAETPDGWVAGDASSSENGMPSGSEDTIQDSGADVTPTDADSSSSSRGEGGASCDEDGDGIWGPQCLGTDCCDTDSKAHPGQLTYYSTRDACGTFDYDCSGAEEPAYGAYLYCIGPASACAALCPSTPCTCKGAECAYGFTGPDPGCGKQGPWGTCSPSTDGCKPGTTVQEFTQGCH